MSHQDVIRVVDCLPGYYLLLRVAPGYPLAALSREAADLVRTGDPLGRPLFEVFPESPGTRGITGPLLRALDRVAASGRPERQELRFDVLDPDTGRFEERYWSTLDTPVTGDDGRVAYILHHAEDAATGRRQGSMAILDAMTEGVFTLDRQWRFAYVNPEAYRILRQAPGSLEGETIWQRFPGAEDSDFGTHYKRTMSERVASAFTAFYPGLEGWYDVTVYPAPEGISVYFRDVTTRVLAEQEHQRLAAESDRQRRIYETALNNTPDFVYIFGTDHRAIYANDALLKVWGVEDVRGKTWIDLGYEQWHADMHDRELAQVIATRAPIRGEIPFTGTNGTRVYDYIFAPVLDPQGHVVAVAGTTRDVTERKAAEQLAREHADRLAEADRAKDAFLATLSHELRNPLAPLRNGVEILRRISGGEGPQAKVHAMMERQVDQLVRLVDDLMEVSRITRGNVSLQREPFDVDDAIESALEAARPAIEAGGHHVVFERATRPLHVDGDRVRISQVVTNLLNNAARYSEPGGTITLALTHSNARLVLSVRDTGIGMEPAEIPHLFEMFTRGDRVKTTHQGGLGIGLALARQLAQLHGGSLDARSEGPGHGSVFELTLPCLAATEDVAAALESPGLPPLSMRVLVVDDNHDVGQSLAQALRLAGADVHVEDSGLGALEACEAARPDVVILDIGMPRITGYDVAATLRSRGVRVPLIALTGWGQAADRERAFAAGFDHHLVKPVSIPKLVQLLASLPLATEAL